MTGSERAKSENSGSSSIGSGSAAATAGFGAATFGSFGMVVLAANGFFTADLVINAGFAESGLRGSLGMMVSHFMRSVPGLHRSR